jgi:acyl-CoA synthetase (AMP-forming)/AMP-acid ligase II
MNPFDPTVVLDPARLPSLLQITVPDAVRSGIDQGASFAVAGTHDEPVAALFDRAENLARGLVREGFEPGDLLVLWFPNGPELPLWAYAAMMAGGAGIFVSPRSVEAEARSLAATASARWTIGRSGDGGFFAHEEALSRFSGAPPSTSLPRLTPDMDAACFTTSGSTGTPKLARMTHRNFAAAVVNTQATLGGGSDDVVLSPTPMCHIGFVLMISAQFVQGRRVIVLPEFDAVGTVEVAREEGATVIGASPTMWSLIMERNSLPDPKLRLRRLMYGSSPMPGHWAERASRTFGCELVHTYGLTESGGCATVLAPERVVEKAGSVGRLLPAFDGIGIHDPDAGAVTPGEAGEICLRGPAVTPGYVARPDDTAAAFRDGWLRTGDLGRIDSDGDLWVTGRLKDQINRGGLKIGAREVEEVIELIPGVTGVAVVGTPDPVLGERVVAVIEADSEALDVNMVRRAASSELADYKVPERILIVPELPRNALQKADKPRVRALVENAIR